MDDEFPLLEPRVERAVVAERDVRNGHVEEGVGQAGFLERLPPDVRVRIQLLRQPGSDGINLDAGDLRLPEHILRHQADEVAQTTGGFQNPAALEAEPLQGGEHGPDHDRGRVVRVERAGTGGIQFTFGKQGFQPFAFRLPLLVPGIKDLGQSAPAHKADQLPEFFGGGGSGFALQALEDFDGGEIVAGLLLERTDADLVLVCDAIVPRVATRRRLVRRNLGLYCSGGRNR